MLKESFIACKIDDKSIYQTSIKLSNFRKKFAKIGISTTNCNVFLHYKK